MEVFRDLNKRELRWFFDRDISGYVFQFNEETSTQEKNAADFINKKYKINLKHFPRVLFPSHINTPDFASMAGGIVVEVKSARSLKNGINNAFKRAKKQYSSLKNGNTFITVIYVEKIKGLEKEIVNVSINRAAAHGLEYYMLIKDDKILFEKSP